MSPLLFTIAINTILDKVDTIIKGIEIQKENKKIKINKMVYMDDLKIYSNKNENIIEIDEKIVNLYKMIGMNINMKKKWNIFT